VAGEVQALKALEDRCPQVELDVEGDTSPSEPPDVGGAEAHHAGAEQQPQPRTEGPAVAQHDVVDDDLLDHRGQRLDDHADDGGAESPGHVAPVVGQEGQQAADPAPSALARWLWSHEPAGSDGLRRSFAPRPMLPLTLPESIRSPSNFRL
jgi:hypothetical protein